MRERKKSSLRGSLTTTAIQGLIMSFVWIASSLPLLAKTAKIVPSHALVMHGTPKYDEGFSHLSYSNLNARQGGNLIQCATGAFDTLNDNTMKGKPAQGLHLINDPLMRRVWDEPFGLYGLIAQNVTLPNDRSSITFHLNPNAIFHDGSRITTADVEFSFNILKAKGKPNTRKVYALVETVTIADDLNITFDFGTGHDRETSLILAMMPIYSKSYWNEKDFDATSLTAPLGNGPYKISSINEGKKITYEKVNDYWAKDLNVNRGHYHFDRMIYDYYRDEQIAMEAFKSNECDVRREFNPARWQTSYNDEDGYIRENLTHSRPEKAQGFIFNTRRAPFNDIRVREALTLAFDFDWMNKSLFHGKAKRITSTFPNSALAQEGKINTDNKRARLKKADALLKSAGWAVKNGKRFDITLLLNKPSQEKIALGFAKDLKRLGITLNIRTLDTAQFFGALNDYDYDMISWRWVNSLSPGAEQSIYWGCAARDIQGSRNYAGICDPAIETAIKGLNTSTTYEDLTKRTQSLDALIMAQYPFIPLYYTGVDHVARWPAVQHPSTQSLYGMVLETWWRDENKN
ncbi:MAG: ABC transporter substrate-binding protein [Alphaproteobacteria bacterium]|nr:MAG: ABC transporter substrate-binding protein [Alphaproteobacteria bacterium]